MDKSETELLCKTHNCQAGCAGWLLSTFFPSPPRPHLFQAEEERTAQLLIPLRRRPWLLLAIQSRTQLPPTQNLSLTLHNTECSGC